MQYAMNTSTLQIFMFSLLLAIIQFSFQFSIYFLASLLLCKLFN